MAMIRDNYEDFLLANLSDIFTKHLGKMKDFIPVLYNVKKSIHAQEFNHGLGKMGLMKNWDDSGGQVYYDTRDKGYKATYTNEKYSLGLSIERELFDDKRYPEVTDITQDFADSVNYSRQLQAVQPFNECLTMLGPDGIALCSTSHPLGPNNATTWSNYTTAKAITADNVEAVRNLMKAWKDDRGNLLLINPDTLIVPKELRKAAKIVADTDNEPFTTDYKVNIWKGSLDVIEVDFLTDSGMWFMVDMNRMKKFLKWYERRKPVLQTDDENFNSEARAYKAVGRWSYGWDDPSFIHGVKTT